MWVEKRENKERGEETEEERKARRKRRREVRGAGYEREEMRDEKGVSRKNDER